MIECFEKYPHVNCETIRSLTYPASWGGRPWMKEQRRTSEGYLEQKVHSTTMVEAWRRLLVLGLGEVLAGGSRLFEQGTAARALYLIEDGILKLIHIGSDGREVILGLRTPGQFAEQCGLACPMTYQATAEAVTEIRFHRIQPERLIEVLRRSREATDLFRIQQSLDLFHASAEIMSLRIESAEQRFERLLHQFANLQPNGNEPRWIRVDALLSNAELAAMISISPEHLSRIKNKMLRAGRLQRQGQVLLFQVNEPEVER